MKILISTFALLCGALLARAEARTETIEYNEAADKRSGAAMQQFFGEIFK